MNRSRWSAVLAGSLGLGFCLAALGVFAWQAVYAMEHRYWFVPTMRHVLNDVVVRRVTPEGFRAWLDRPPSAGPVSAVVAWFLDEVPLVVVLGGIAVLFLLSARRSERSGARR